MNSTTEFISLWDVVPIIIILMGMIVLILRLDWILDKINDFIRRKN